MGSESFDVRLDREAAPLEDDLGRDEPSDADLVAFARLLIGDTEPFLDPEGLVDAIDRNRDLWVRLYRVDAGLEEIEELRPERKSP